MTIKLATICCSFVAVSAFSPTALASTASIGGCTLGAADQAWVAGTTRAWSEVSAKVERQAVRPPIQAVFFDAQCVVSSTTAMSGRAGRWRAREHDGAIRLPDGQTVPAGVTSFTTGSGGRTFFVMSTPSIWRAAGKSDNGLGSLENLMTAVAIHEATHVAQGATYGRAIQLLMNQNRLPETFDDNAIQQRFKGEEEFASAIAQETNLFLAASASPDKRIALARLRDARRLMIERQRRWYSDTPYLADAEDVWLTMEGSAQWAGYRWLTSPRGPGLDRALVTASFAKGKWWSQTEGFAIFLALDRVAGPAWKRRIFGRSGETATSLIDTAARFAPKHGARRA